MENASLKKAKSFLKCAISAFTRVLDSLWKSFHELALAEHTQRHVQVQCFALVIKMLTNKAKRAVDAAVDAWTTTINRVVDLHKKYANNATAITEEEKNQVYKRAFVDANKACDVAVQKCTHVEDIITAYHICGSQEKLQKRNIRVKNFLYICIKK
jgi:hypothetical protein